MYALIKNGEVSKYPITLTQEFPNTSFSDAPAEEALVDLDVFPVTPTAPPACDPIMQTLHEDTPIWIDGQWMKVWDATNNYGFYSYIDSVRITKSVARYTADFTPSQIEFRK